MASKISNHSPQMERKRIAGEIQTDRIVHSTSAFVSIPLVSLVYLRFHSVEQFFYDKDLGYKYTTMALEYDVQTNGAKKNEKERNLCIASHRIGYHIPKRIKAYVYLYVCVHGMNGQIEMEGVERLNPIPVARYYADAFVLCSNLAYAYPICIWRDGYIIIHAPHGLSLSI